MAFTDKGVQSAKKAQEHADCVASLARSRKDIIDERDEMYKDVKLPDNLVTPEDHINYAKSVVLGFGKKKTGEKSGQVLEAKSKKKCLNCGSPDIRRQYDKTKSTEKEIVWTDEYECMEYSCKTRFKLSG